MNGWLFLSRTALAGSGRASFDQENQVGQKRRIAAPRIAPVCLPLLLAAASMLAAHAGAQSWTQLTPTGTPPPYFGCCATVVGDSNGDMIVFGGANGSGHNGTYVLQHANGLNGTPTWIQLSPTGTLPAARGNASSVYDSATNRLIIFGGCEGGCLPVANDVWVLTNANGTGGTPAWVALSPSGTAPSARQSAVAGYDPVTNRMVLFGGQNGGGAGGVFSDTWVLTNANGTGAADPVTKTTTPTWIQLSAGTAPSFGDAAAAFYDAVDNRLVVAGGSNGSAQSDAVWVLSNANGMGGTPAWTQLIAEGASGAPPDFASFENTGYDPATDSAFLLLETELTLWQLTNAGGTSGTPPWTQLNFTGLPSGTGIGSQGSAFDAASGRFTVVVQDSTTSTDQVWVAQVEAMSTKVSLSSSGNPSDTGDPVTFTANVTAASGTPTGSITFYDGTTALATSGLSSGQASFTTSSLAAGSHAISADYTPNSSQYAASTGSLVETVISLSDLALLNGNNTFTGNQTVIGTVTAKNFVGNGAGLTGVIAAGLNCAGCVTNSMLTLPYAIGDAQGGNALNALKLGGLPASAFAPASGSTSYVPLSGGTMSGPLYSTQFSAPLFTSGAAGQNLSIEPLKGTGNGGEVSILAGNAGTNGGAGGDLMLTAGNAVPQGGVGYTNQGPAGKVTIAAGAGYNGVGGNVMIRSGANSNWSLTNNGFSVVQLQGGTLLGHDGAWLEVESAHNGSSTNAALSYGGNIWMVGGNGQGGLSGGNIYLSPGSGSPTGRVVVTGNLTTNGNVAATSFSGNGSGLTGITAASATTITGSIKDTQVTNLTTDLSNASASAVTTAENFANSKFLPLAGGTLTGTLKVPGNGLTAGTNQLVLNGGYVGIGNASPYAPLTVRRTSSSLPNVVDPNMVALFDNGGNASNVYTNVLPAGSGGTDENYYFALNGVMTGGIRYNVGGDYVALFHDHNSNDVGNEPFVLQGRNIGIGTLKPLFPLDVTGNVRATGTITANQFSGSGAGLVGVPSTAITGNFSETQVTNLTTDLANASTSAVSTAESYANSTFLPLAGGALTGPVSAPEVETAAINSGVAGQNLSIQALDGTGNGGAVSISAGNAGGSSGGGGGNLTLTAGNATPQGGSGYTNQGPAGQVMIAAGAGYNGVGGNVLIESGPNSNWSQTTNGFSSVQIQGGTLLGGDGAKLQVESAHNGSSTNAALSYGGNISLTGGNGQGGLAGGSITLTPGSGSPNGMVTVAGNLTVNGTVTAVSFNPTGAASIPALTIGSGGTAITEHLSIVTNPAIPALGAGMCQQIPETLKGAADGDTVALGVSGARMTGGGSLVYTAWVSAPNTVIIQACNVNPAQAQKTAGTGTIRIDLWKH